jgi:hypothetical protein
LFSPVERSAFRLLEEVVGDKYRILPRVQAADVVGVKVMADQSAWFRAVDQISSRNFDFVLCDKDFLSIACAIKLNHAAQPSQQGEERDAFLLDVCKTISLPVVEITVPDDLSASELRKKIYGALNQDLEAKVASSETPFSVGLPPSSIVGDRPWTMDKARLVEGDAPKFQLRRTL